MGRKGAGKKQKTAVSGPPPRAPMTLREEANGRKQGNVNARSMLRIDHLKGLALWAATEASIPSLGAFFGQRLAASTEAVGVRSDPSLFFCERCESVLQPGHNCTVRVETNKPRKRRRNTKSGNATQNNVVYNCHFCSNRNIMRGTPKGYMQEISPPKTKQPSRLDAADNVVERSTRLTQATPTAVTDNKMAAVTFLITDKQCLEPSSPATPLPTTGLSLLDGKRRKRTRQTAKTTAEQEGSSIAADLEKSRCTSSKRRRKSWTSLKEIAQSAEHDTVKKLTNLTVPLFM